VNKQQESYGTEKHVLLHNVPREQVRRGDFDHGAPFRDAHNVEVLLVRTLHRRVGKKGLEMNPKWKVTRHHRKPRCSGGSNDRRNVSKVPLNRHEAYHLLFNEGDPQYIAKVLSETWIDPDYIMIAVRRSEISTA